jgi:hypothetical protein
VCCMRGVGHLRSHPVRSAHERAVPAVQEVTRTYS